MKNKKELSVFIASPGDVLPERNIIRAVCEELNREVLIREKEIYFQAVGWEDAFPEAGRPQDTLNRLLEEADIFVCLFHKRFGSPTGEAASGTLEEFLLAYDLWKETKKPHIMFYFKEVTVSSINDFDDPQLKSVLRLKETIKDSRILLFDDFTDSDQFHDKLADHLKKWVVKNFRTQKPSSGRIKKKKQAARLGIPDSYRAWLMDHCANMDIDKLREKGRVIQVRLPEIFVPLYANPPGKTFADDQALHRMARQKEGAEDIEKLAADSEYLLVEGLPGSGKTTLMKHLSYRLIEDTGPDNLKGFLPVLVFLKYLKRFYRKLKNRQPTASTAETILAQYFKSTESGLDIETVKAFCRAGKSLFLLDGLDEIEPEMRDILAHSFADFRIKNPGAKLMLTGRSHAMEAGIIDRFGDRHVRIEPFSTNQIEEFIQKWFLYVFEKESTIGSKTARQMIGDIKVHPGIERLKDNPLMLTAICILYLDERELPGQRAELYRKFINNLLSRRFDDPERVHNFLKTLALTLQTQGEKGIDRTPAINILGSVYPEKTGETRQRYLKRVEALFDQIEPDCGLLTFENGQYGFRHLTFQEFFAAAALVDSETNYSKAIEDFWVDEHYREVIELYIGYLSIENRRWANKIVEDAFQKKDTEPYQRWLLAARALLDIHRDRREPPVLEMARKKLVSILSSEGGPKTRSDAGEVLGWLGDERNLESFVSVKGGQYNLSIGTFKILPFQMSRFPVTNHWFEKFVEDGGYKNFPYWSKEGKKWLKHTRYKHPILWEDRRWTCPNAPVVGVSWYEADAFVRWLTMTKKDGYLYRLPDEKEWEAAAAGPLGRKYPWGDEWIEDRCNTREAGIEKASSVGIFEKGNTPEGIVDLAGNVWEWTRTDYHSEKDRADFQFDEELQKLFDSKDFEEYIKKIEEKDRQLPVLRGGSWFNFPDYARCAYRYWFFPLGRYILLGFRCVRTKNK